MELFFQRQNQKKEKKSKNLFLKANKRSAVCQSCCEGFYRNLSNRIGLLPLHQKTKNSSAAGYSTDISVSGTLALTGLSLTVAAVGAAVVGCTHLHHVGPGMTYKSTCHPCRKLVR